LSAQIVPETRDLDSEDAWQILRRIHYVPLARESLQRFRDADGYSHARAIGLQFILAALPALIFFVAVSVWTGSSVLQSSIESIVSSISPGGSGGSGFLQQAIDQGEQNARGNTLAMILGGLAALVSATAGMAQIQKSATRMYGVTEDRPMQQRYGLAFVLAMSVGALLGAAALAISFGGVIMDALEGESIWAWLRWPLGIVATIVGFTVLYKVAPNRDQPTLSWLAVGGLTGTGMWLLLSGGLALYLALSSTFGETYGPLAGLVGLLLWSQLTGFAVVAGIAFAAQLEAEREDSSAKESAAS
jgi:YihY family inner membrane protein